MKNYERLTNPNLEEYYTKHDFCLGCDHFENHTCKRWNGNCANYEDFNRVYDRLFDLEDKIERGEIDYVADKDKEIARLTEENAELKARLDKAVELPFFQKDGAVIVLIYKNKDGIVLIEKYIEDEYYNGKRGKEAAEARLAELKGGDKQ